MRLWLVDVGMGFQDGGEDARERSLDIVIEARALRRAVKDGARWAERRCVELEATFPNARVNSMRVCEFRPATVDADGNASRPNRAGPLYCWKLDDGVPLGEEA